jgi:hypothetical protein
MTGTIRGRGIDANGQHHELSTKPADRPCCRTDARRMVVEDARDRRITAPTALTLLGLIRDSELPENCPAHPADPWRTP